MITDEIVEIECIGWEDTIDINTTGNRLFYANGILTHNSAVEEVEFDHSHIAGGLSKINTADNVFGIFTSRAMRERGRYQIQAMKTRSSSGVGNKIDLDFDINSLRISDSGIQGTANNTGTIAANVMASIKSSTPLTASAINSGSPVQKPADDDYEVEKVVATGQSAKLNQLLNRIKTGNT